MPAAGAPTTARRSAERRRGFPPGGASASYLASRAQLGGLLDAGIKLARKRKAGGLPDKVMLALTRRKLHAFKLRVGREHRLAEEVAVWDRDDSRITTSQSGAMSALTIESPQEGERATLVGVGVMEDPLSQELIAILRADPNPA